MNLKKALNKLAHAEGNDFPNELPAEKPPLEQWERDKLDEQDELDETDNPFSYSACIAGCEWEFDHGVGWFRKIFQFNLPLHMKHCKAICRCTECGDDQECRERFNCEFWEDYVVPST